MTARFSDRAAPSRLREFPARFEIAGSLKGLYPASPTADRNIYVSPGRKELP